MDRKRFLSWLTGWISKNPLRNPPQTSKASYTDEVMRKIQAQDAPAPLVVRWIPAPRLAWSTGMVAASLVVWFMIGTPFAPGISPEGIQQELAVLIELDEPVDLPISELRLQIAEVDNWVFAEAEIMSQQEDEIWIEESLELFNEFEEDSLGDTDDESLDDLLEELWLLDESELASS